MPKYDDFANAQTAFKKKFKLPVSLIIKIIYVSDLGHNFQQQFSDLSAEYGLFQRDQRVCTTRNFLLTINVQTVHVG